MLPDFRLRSPIREATSRGRQSARAVTVLSGGLCMPMSIMAVDIATTNRFPKVKLRSLKRNLSCASVGMGHRGLLRALSATTHSRSAHINLGKDAGAPTADHVFERRKNAARVPSRFILTWLSADSTSWALKP